MTATKTTTPLRGQRRPRANRHGIPLRMIEDSARNPTMLAVIRAFERVRFQRVARARWAQILGVASAKDDEIVARDNEQPRMIREATLTAEQAQARIVADYEAARDRVTG